MTTNTITREEVAERVVSAVLAILDYLEGSMEAPPMKRPPEPTPSPIDDPSRELISVREAAKLCGRTARWVYEYKERLPFVVIQPDGGCRVSAPKLRAWLDAVPLVPRWHSEKREKDGAK